MSDKFFNDPLLTIQVKKEYPDSIIPTRATEGSAGWDLYSYETICIRSFDVYSVGCGISISIPLGYYALILPRSGLSIKGLNIINSPGLIDSDYRGEVKILITLRREFGLQWFEISKGDRIAQLLICQDTLPLFKEVDKLNPTIRGPKGFGSTGL